MLRPPKLFADWTRNFALLAVTTASVGAFFGVQLTLYNNFIVERLGIEAHQLGAVEALREIPGFLNVLFIALMIHIAPSLTGGVAVIIMGFGIMGYAVTGSVLALAVYSLLWSLAFHCWAPLSQALALDFSPTQEKGRWLGRLRSVQSIAWVLAIAACMALLPVLGYEGMFIAAGVVAVLGGATLLFATRDHPKVKPKRMVLKRRYATYYALNFLQGCRKQMFITFAIFALVKVHGMPVKTTMTLVLINQILIFFSGPTAGRLIDRLGERAMLSASYIGLFFVFLGYACITHRPTLYLLYCIDNLIFFGGMALTTYINKIASAEDLRPTLSMGVTMNHVAAVIAPLTGGLVWSLFGYQVIFIAGAVLCLVSLGVSQLVRAPASEEPNPEWQDKR